MAIKVPGVPNILFPNSGENNLGIGENETRITQSAVKSFIVGGASEQYDVTTSFAEVTGMSVVHESLTGKVMVIFSGTVAPGVGEIVNIKLQKDGVDVEGTEQTVLVAVSPGTSHVSVHGSNFLPSQWDEQILRGDSEGMALGVGSGAFVCPLNLPHGAVITGALVTGGDTNDTWALKRQHQTTQDVDTLASGNFKTEDTSISNAIVDNDTYTYLFTTGTVADDVISAEVTYTVDPFSISGENSHIPVTIHIIDEDVALSTWRIVAKTSQNTPDDSFINDRVLSIVDLK